MTLLEQSNNQTYTDMLGREISLPKHKNLRIISLVPSQTELLVDLGLEEQIVGITKFCIHPNHVFKSKPRIGGTKEFDFDKIASLQPDIIIANKEENEKKQIEKLCDLYPVWISDIYTLQDNNNMILQLGDIFNVAPKANKIVESIQLNFAHLSDGFKQKSVAYFIWRKPYMVAAKNTFINHILADKLGLINVFEDQQRYPIVDAKELSLQNPQLVFLSSEPYPFQEKHKQELLQIWPNAEIMLVDGELFSWYGSRLKHAPAYFNKLMCITQAS